ncbi:hypothetical protein JKF63_03528 [Porcisia hertigi]|uniref:ATP-grasp domain-containing protein n=1 Tax=Porcisia hertigi TaxID=2761500 RepID=A0A836L9P6_9TRYP|nr:hypothetical protein JKF63_03528 [Porcisia hertigi]
MSFENAMGNSTSEMRSTVVADQSASTSRDRPRDGGAPPSKSPFKTASLSASPSYLAKPRPAGVQRPPRGVMEQDNTSPAPRTTPATDLTSPPLQEQQQKLARELQLTFCCSEACATSTVMAHYPDAEECQTIILAKMSAPFLLDVGMVSAQREYIDSLHQGLDVAFRDFPFLNGSAKPHEEKPQSIEIAARGEGSGRGLVSSPSAPIDWAEVRNRLFSANKAPLWYRHTGLELPGDIHDLRVYENAYQNLIVKEGLSYVIGCYAAGDGLVPVMDYVNARLSGESAESLARRMGFGDDVAGVLDGLEAEAPTRVYTRVNAFGNDPATSWSSRQNKGHAQQVLKEAGLAYIRSHVTTSVEVAVKKVKDGALLLPVVVKPNTGAGSEHVTLCYTVDDLYVAFSMVQNLRTSQGTDAGQLVVEEYIEGTEYIVNTVSYQGVHVVTDVWQSWKYPHPVFTTGLTRSAEEDLRTAGVERAKLHKTTILYDKQTLITSLADLPASHSARRVVEYTFKCLDALGLRNGCGHSELRLDARRPACEGRRQEPHRLHKSDSPCTADPASLGEGEPILIELNSRMQGDTPRGTNVIGYDQYSLMVYIAAALNVFGGATPASTRFPFRINSSSVLPQVGEIPWPPVPRLYRAKSPEGARMTTSVLFLATRDECILNGHALRALSELPTFQRFTRTLFKPNRPGFVTSLRQTIDLFSSPTACVMVGLANEVEADCAVIRAMESAPLSSSTSEALSKLISAKKKAKVWEEELQKIDKHVSDVMKMYREVAARNGLSADRFFEDRRENSGQSEEGVVLPELKALHRRITELRAEWGPRKCALAVCEEDVQSLKKTFANALTSQKPAPLYISYSDLDRMRVAGVADELSVV